MALMMNSREESNISPVPLIMNANKEKPVIIVNPERYNNQAKEGEDDDKYNEDEF